MKALNQQSRVPSSVMPDLLMTLEDFAGETSPAEADAWLSNIETIGKLHSWSDAIYIEAIKWKVRGAAKDWYLAHRDELITWSKIRTEFKKKKRLWVP